MTSKEGKNVFYKFKLCINCMHKESSSLVEPCKRCVSVTWVGTVDRPEFKRPPIPYEELEGNYEAI